MDDPKKIQGKAPDKTGFLTGSLEIFDINILPARYQRKKIRLVAFLPWLLFVVLLAGLYPSLIIAQEAQSVFIRTRVEVAALQASMETYQSAADKMTALQAEIDLATYRRDLIKASYQGIDLQGSTWSPTLFRIEQTAPDGISWTSFVQQEQEIHLEGIANTYQVILDLQDTLSSLGEFSKVQINSVDQIIIEPGEILIAAAAEDGQPATTPEPTYSFSLVAILDLGGHR